MYMAVDPYIQQGDITFSKLDKRRWTILKSTGTFYKYPQGTLPFLRMDRRHWGSLRIDKNISKIAMWDVAIA